MADPMAPANSTEPLLAGRERELGVLRASLETALDGHGTLVLIGGEAGIGKTTLAEALCAEAVEQGVRVLVGRCYDLSETPPYGPWTEALARTSGGMGLPALPAALLPPERSDGEALVGQDAIVRRVQNYLTALANRRPLVLLLEDLHWADPASLDLLRVVARELGVVSLLILATYRADELTGRHPLAQLLPLLVREARAERLDLRPLAAAAIGALVASRYALGAADAARLVVYLAAHADGNPLFLGELLRTLEGEGLISRAGTAWTLGNLDRVPVPELLQQLIAGRLARLDEATQHLLALAATIGQEVPLDLWAALGDLPEEALLPHIERAVGARLLTETPDGTAVRFVHALVREALYRGAPAIHRRAWHRRVGEALAVRPAPDPDAVAYHLRQAGDERAVEWLVRASERAQRAYAFSVAADRVEAALALLERRRGDLAERGWLCVQLSRLLRHADQRRALAFAEQGLALAAESGDRALAAYTRGHLSLLRCRAGQLRDGLAMIVVALEARESLRPDERERLAARRAALGESLPTTFFMGSLANWLAIAGRYAEAEALAAALVAADTSVRDADHALACFTLGLATTNLGRVDEGARWFAESRAICRAVGEYFGIGQYAFMQNLHFHRPYRADQPDEREHLALEAAAGFRLAAGAVRADAPPGLERLPLMVLAGEWGSAWNLAQTVRASEGLNVPNALLLLGPLALARGETAFAWELVLETLPAGPATEPGDCWFRTGVALQLVAAARRSTRATCRSRAPGWRRTTAG
ncbi:MAG: AAA family ATPase [Chloroflexia bacterium]